QIATGHHLDDAIRDAFLWWGLAVIATTAATIVTFRFMLQRYPWCSTANIGTAPAVAQPAAKNGCQAGSES
ncbi:hypothetical protein ACX9NE_28355, partial [Mycobacterium sp. ML4]